MPRKNSLQGMPVSASVRPSAHVIAGFVLLFFWALTACAYEIAPIKIVVNAQDDGDYFVLLGSYGEVFLALDDIAKLGLPAGETAVRLNGVSYASLSSYRPKLNFKFDANDSVLEINADPSMFNKTVVDLARNDPRPNVLAIETAILNYAVTRRGLSDGSDSAVEVPFEGVINAHGFVFRANYQYRQDPSYRSWMHTFTSVSKDFPRSATRLVMGDFSADSGELGSGGVFGGVSFGKVFSISPSLITYPGLAVSGVLETPSQVDVYLNNALLSSERLPAGSFELNNVPSIYGGGVVTVVIKDAFGRERRESLPVYISSRLLNVGLHAFNYSLGFNRKGSLSSSLTYDDSPMLLGYHRLGITRAITAGMRFEAGSKLLNAGPTAEVLLGGWGEVGAGLAGSQSAERDTGYAGYLHYSSSQRYTHFRLSVVSASGNYTTMSNYASENRPHVAKNVSVGLHSLPIGGLSFNWNTTRRYDSVPKRDISLLYTARLGRNVSMILRANRSFEGAAVDDLLWLSLNMSLGGQVSGGASYTKEEDNFSRALSLQKSTPVGPGFGFRLQGADDAELQQSGDWRGDAAVQYKVRTAAFGADYQRTKGLDSYNLSMAGAVAFIDDSLFLSRPIRDSFSLVKIGDLENVRVYFGSESVGETRRGKLLVPNIVSYGRNAVSIEPQDVPIDFTLSHIQQIVAPSYRSGAVARFNVARFQGYTGHLYLRDRARRWTADFADLVLTDKTGSVSSTVGKGGEFYFENLRPGRYVARATLKRQRCDFPLTVPVSDAMVVELGEVTCDL